jgi:hypothetical protein
MVGRGGLEPPTSRLSGVRSNHLSYRPILVEPVTGLSSQDIGYANTLPDYALTMSVLCASRDLAAQGTAGPSLPPPEEAWWSLAGSNR